MAVLEHLRRNPETGLWPAVTYFSLWAVRLSGFCRTFGWARSPAIAEEMMQTPIGQFTDANGTAVTASDLRRFLVRPSKIMSSASSSPLPFLEAL